VAVDLLAVEFLHVVGEEVGDVLVGGPVQRHAQVIAVLGLELVLQVLAREPVGAEPVQVGELLVGQLVELAVRRRGELVPMKSLRSMPGLVNSLPAPAM
jgi:branched-subunit amino acid ABC-type transport system permease component